MLSWRRLRIHVVHNSLLFRWLLGVEYYTVSTGATIVAGRSTADCWYRIQDRPSPVYCVMAVAAIWLPRRITSPLPSRFFALSTVGSLMWLDIAVLFDEPGWMQLYLTVNFR